MSFAKLSTYMIRHKRIDDSEVLRVIKSGLIRYGGNRKQKIYGTLTCKSGKRMKRQNRVFFKTEKTPLTMVIVLVELV